MFVSFVFGMWRKAAAYFHILSEFNFYNSNSGSEKGNGRCRFIRMDV